MARGLGGGYGKGGGGGPGSLGKRTSASRLHSVEQMPVISEGAADAADQQILEKSSDPFSSSPSTPQIPAKSHARRSAALRDAQFPYPGSPPPAYRSTTPSTSDPSNSTRSYDVGPQDPLPKDRRPGWMVKRGGWWKIVLGVVVGVICVVALAVGLAVGLRRSSSASSSGNNDNSGSSNNQGNSGPAFPAGSYAFTTALDNVSTACTTETSAFRCYPYTTYAQSNSSSKAVFFWTIAQSSSSSQPPAYKISAARNPFVPQFDNVDMQFLEPGSANERLVFQFPMNAAVVPSPPLSVQQTGGTASGSAGTVTCYYNNTIMGATIYTRRAATYPVGLSSPVHNNAASGSGSSTSTSSTSSTTFDPWPYAVDVRQIATAGQGVPDCRDSQGNPVGNLTVLDSSAACSCTYQNYDL
ncbi:uncharacterized protein B0I36DRAFT_351127 [Microdochium trichocladiopsis]|uniref:Tat pathway signal sequence n=1 Tax=Microdochium trichocladiopsis TaxID=1682393 RepID=A0A9P8Y349_9PEZI|nr:uncharacterized protein B0I36DRAFT_351127 [Microdochium trichocladiopsis]KAH7027614.1 hypothetical protein B0I36DRAFT_351127 [Microdochium trichocladiopsis]